MSTARPRELSYDDRIWLRKLHTALWVKREDWYCGKPREWWTETRVITSEEWDGIQELAPLCLVEPINACMGFNFGIVLYDIWDDEYQEARKTVKAFGGRPERPERLLCLTGHHTNTNFEGTWEKLSPFSHNPKNESLLAEFEFAKLERKGYYDY